MAGSGGAGSDICTSPRDGNNAPSCSAESWRYSRRLGRQPRPAPSQQRGPAWPRRCSCQLTSRLRLPFQSSSRRSRSARSVSSCGDGGAPIACSIDARRSIPAARRRTSVQGLRDLVFVSCRQRRVRTTKEPIYAALTHAHLEALPLPGGHVSAGWRLIAWWLVHDGTGSKMWARSGSTDGSRSGEQQAPSLCSADPEPCAGCTKSVTSTQSELSPKSVRPQLTVGDAPPLGDDEHRAEADRPGTHDNSPQVPETKIGLCSRDGQWIYFSWGPNRPLSLSDQVTRHQRDNSRRQPDDTEHDEHD